MKETLLDEKKVEQCIRNIGYMFALVIYLSLDASVEARRHWVGCTKYCLMDGSSDVTC